MNESAHSLHRLLSLAFAVACLLGAIMPAALAGTNRTLNLDQCLELAFEQNHRRAASRFAVAAAEAQHRQALAGYWPQVHARGTYQHLDDSPNFVFPASSISTPAGSMPVPEQDVKLMSPDSVIASASAAWLLYDGGMRKGYREQSAAGVDAVRQDARRTDLEINDSVRRMYYGAVLAAQLHQVGRDTLARLEATLGLTETMYKEGSGKVTKADFLDNKVIVESVRSMVAQLGKNEIMSRAALAYSVGFAWNESIVPADRDIPFATYAAKLDEMVSTAYEFSPDWARLEAGIRAADGAVRTARSGHHPKIAITGEIHRWWNDYDAGMASARNKEGYVAGIGLELPLFDGFLTRNKVREANARAGKIREEKFVFQEAIGLQVKEIFIGLNAFGKSHQATLDAMNAAVENRDLNIRAYQNELVETEKVIRAQLTEAMMSAIHFKTRYDHVALQSQLNLVVGTEIWKRLHGSE